MKSNVSKYICEPNQKQKEPNNIVIATSNWQFGTGRKGFVKN